MHRARKGSKVAAAGVGGILFDPSIAVERHTSVVASVHRLGVGWGVNQTLLISSALMALIPSTLSMDLPQQQWTHGARCARYQPGVSARPRRGRLRHDSARSLDISVTWSLLVLLGPGIPCIDKQRPTAKSPL